MKMVSVPGMLSLLKLQEIRSRASHEISGSEKLKDSRLSYQKQKFLQTKLKEQQML